jgi:hypothetical protein
VGRAHGGAAVATGGAPDGGGEQVRNVAVAVVCARGARSLESCALDVRRGASGLPSARDEVPPRAVVVEAAAGLGLGRAPLEPELAGLGAPGAAEKDDGASAAIAPSMEASAAMCRGSGEGSRSSREVSAISLVLGGPERSWSSSNWLLPRVRGDGGSELKRIEVGASAVHVVCTGADSEESRVPGEPCSANRTCEPTHGLASAFAAGMVDPVMEREVVGLDCDVEERAVRKGALTRASLQRCAGHKAGMALNGALRRASVQCCAGQKAGAAPPAACRG